MVKNLPANSGDTRDAGSVPGLGRSPGGGHGDPLQYSGFPGGAMVKNPPAMQETQSESLGPEYPLEEEMMWGIFSCAFLAFCMSLEKRLLRSSAYF